MHDFCLRSIRIGICQAIDGEKSMISRNHAGHRIGESHVRAKVPDEVVRKAREMNDQGIGYVRISKALSVSPSTVANWCQYRTRWSA